MCLSSQTIVDVHIVWLLLKHLDHLANALGGPLPEQEPGPVLHQLRLTEEAEDDGAPVVGVESPGAKDPLHHGRLPHVANVYRGLEASANAGGVVQHLSPCLQGINR